MRATSIIVAVLALIPAESSAHSLPKNYFERLIEVRVEPTGMQIRYVLTLAEETMQFDALKCLSAADITKLRDNPRAVLRTLYATAKAEQMRRGFIITLDTEDLPVNLRKVDVVQQDHNVQYTFHFEGRWTLLPGKPHDFRFSDETPYLNKNGSNLSEDADGPVTLNVRERYPGTFADIDTEEPTRQHGKPRDRLNPDEETRRRTCTAQFRIDAPAPVAPADPIAEPTITLTESAADVSTQLRERGLKALLESDLGLAMLLLLAAVFGAAHAFTPGHGKTMVAAYLIGERGTIWHAVVLGGTATLAHTGSVFVLAVVLYTCYGNVPPQQTQAWLMLAGGLLIFTVGLWLLLQRLRGRADHVHLFTGSTPTAKPKLKSNFGWLRVILLGLGGGLIPCWDAVMMLLMAMAQGRLGLAIPMLLAFSLGLASVMILLGVGVVLAHRRGLRTLGENRWFRRLPIFSAVVLVGLGLWFLRDGFRQLLAATAG